jgi:cytochrome c biogenesis protein CcdA
MARAMILDPEAAAAAAKLALLWNAILMELVILLVCLTIGRQRSPANRARVLRANIFFFAGILLVMIARGIPASTLVFKLMLYADVVGLVVVAAMTATQAEACNGIGQFEFALASTQKTHDEHTPGTSPVAA